MPQQAASVPIGNTRSKRLLGTITIAALIAAASSFHGTHFAGLRTLVSADAAVLDASGYNPMLDDTRFSAEDVWLAEAGDYLSDLRSKAASLGVVAAQRSSYSSPSAPVSLDAALDAILFASSTQRKAKKGSTSQKAPSPFGGGALSPPVGAYGPQYHFPMLGNDNLASPSKRQGLLPSSSSPAAWNVDSEVDLVALGLSAAGCADMVQGNEKSAAASLEAAASSFAQSPLLSPSFVIPLSTPERVSWELGQTAGRKHKRIFGSLDDTGVASAQSTTSTRKKATTSVVIGDDNGGDGKRKQRATADTSITSTFIPNEYFMNHLINTKQSVAGILMLWQESVKPFIVNGTVSRSSTVAASGLPPTAPSARSSSSSVTATAMLSCMQFSGGVFGTTTDANANKNDGSTCRFVDELLLGAKGQQHPVSAQKFTMWELINDVGSVAMMRTASAASALSTYASLSASTSAASNTAVADASEMLYWLLGADDYVNGRGRHLQEVLLLDMLQEDAGEGSSWSRVHPRSVLGQVSATVKSSSSSSSGVAYAFSPNRLSHVQSTAYRTGLDGYGVLTPIPMTLDHITYQALEGALSATSVMNSQTGTTVSTNRAASASSATGPNGASVSVPIAKANEVIRSMLDGTLVAPATLVNANNYKIPTKTQREMRDSLDAMLYVPWFFVNDTAAIHTLLGAVDAATARNRADAKLDGSIGGGANNAHYKDHANANIAVVSAIKSFFPQTLVDRNSLINVTAGDLALPFPFGITREGGRLMLEAWYSAKWDIIKAIHTAVVKDGESSSLSPFANSFCAPMTITQPKCYAQTERDGHRTGKDALVQTITGDENRNRQLPLRLEANALLSVDGKRISKALDAFAMDTDAVNNPKIIRNAEAFALDMTKRTLMNPLQQLIASVRNSRRLKVFPKLGGIFASTAYAASSAASTTLVPIVVDNFHYQPFLDPKSPQYRRIICATYTYHKNIGRAINFHRTSAHLCDKHLLFTDKPLTPEEMAKLDRHRYVVMALNTPMGEDYMNMWQKTRMILDRVELMVRGLDESTDEEGANDPVRVARMYVSGLAPSNSPTRAAAGAVNAADVEGPPQFVVKSNNNKRDSSRSSQSQSNNHADMFREDNLADADNDDDAGDDVDLTAIASALLPHYAGYDAVLLSGDDVCLNMPKVRRYLAESEEMYSVSTPNRHRYGPFAYAGITTNRDGSSVSNLVAGVDDDASYNGQPYGSAQVVGLLSSSKMLSAASFTSGHRFGFHRSGTTPQHIGYSHRHFISGATYIMNRQGYSNFMSGAYSTCEEKGRTFAEDVLMGWCHRDVGLIHRNAGHFGYGEDVMSCVGLDYITGMTHTVYHTTWISEYKRRAIPRGGPITSRDSIEHHFCGDEEMARQVQDNYGETVPALAP